MFRKIVVMVLCLSILNISMAVASQPCLMCSDDMQEQMREMGYKVEVTVEGVMVTNILTGEKFTIINPEGSSGYCTALFTCMIFTFFIAFGIFFFPCYIVWAGSCT